MTRSNSEPTELYWSYSRMGYDLDTLAVLSREVKINPQRPPYPLVSARQIPIGKEVELLVCRQDATWMKIRAYVEDGQISYVAYRSYGQTVMPDGLSAIRQQILDPGQINPPYRESLLMFAGKFMKIHKLPDLTEWDRTLAQQWLEAQNTPGTAVNLCHLRALDNNYVPESWIPVWLRTGRELFKQGPMSIARMEEMADEAERMQRTLPEMQDTSHMVVGRGEYEEEYGARKGWWERTKMWWRGRFKKAS